MKARKRNKALKSIIILLILLALGVLLFTWLFNTRGTTDISISPDIERITVTSSAFENMGTIPVDYTGDGEDRSPDLHLVNLSGEAVSVAVILDDLDVPWMGNYTHWTIWNIPAMEDIPEAIAHGPAVESLENAVQGMGFGRNRYRGPKPPFGTHRYQFHVLVLDTILDLSSDAGKAELLEAMDGHILQYGTLTGWYPEAK